MSTNDIIGWLATILTLSSFLVNDIIKLRVINAVGCVCWIIYGIGGHNYPVIITNVVILMIHFFWFNKNKKKAKGE